MTRRFLYVLTAALVALPVATTIQPSSAAAGPDCGPTVRKVDGTPWVCRFSDEFNGTTLDGSKWVAQQTAISGNSGNKADCWVDRPANISVGGGALRLTSRKEAKPFLCTGPKGNYRTSYTSGGVTTWGRFEQTYGRWQIRAKFPKVDVIGSHGALWLYPRKSAYGDWPLSGEIDIAEFYSRLPDRVYPVIHYRAKGRSNLTTSTKGCMVADPWNFHLYTAEWTKTTIRIWADDKLCVNHTLNPHYPLTGSQPFDRPFVTNLTQTLGAGQNRFRRIGRNPTPLPLQTQIDWVHIWS
jgi:beta-glucanase (GH16 family)